MRKPLLVTSLQNRRIKAVRALRLQKNRRNTGLFVAEGGSVVVRAKECGFFPTTLLYRYGLPRTGALGELISSCLKKHIDCLEVSEIVLEKLAARDNPKSVLGVYRQNYLNPPELSCVKDDDLWLVLENIRDPGNLGAIIRTVEAVGAKGVILVGLCCDPFSKECVRATMGSFFVVPIVQMSTDSFLNWSAQWRGAVVGFHLKGTSDFRDLDLSKPTLLLMGGESSGLSEMLSNICPLLVKIPMCGQLDSLNLAVAASLGLYQARKRYLSV